MNNAILVQIADIDPRQEDGEWKKILALTLPRTLEYCRLNHFDYRLIDGPVRYWDRTTPNMLMWGKLALVQQVLLQGYQYVAYLDTDTLIWDLHADMRQACVKPINMARWWEGSPSLAHYQAGVVYYHQTPTCSAYGIVSRILEEAKFFIERFPTWRGGMDQGHLNEVANEPGGDAFVGPVDIRWNWYPDWLSNNGGPNQQPVPCKNPVVLGFHGYRPLDKLADEVKRILSRSSLPHK